MLLQDGHEIEHLIPPRDLRSWQKLPISAIANFKPVVVGDLSEVALKQLIAQHPYRYFPVVQNDRVRGFVSRQEIEQAVAQNRTLQLQCALACRPGDSIRETQKLLIESTTGTVVITDPSGEKLLAMVTLQDLLRAQVSMSEREGNQ